MLDKILTMHVFAEKVRKEKQMFGLPLREFLFLGGAGLMGCSIVLLILCMAVSMFTGKRLKKILEAEYGKPQK